MTSKSTPIGKSASASRKTSAPALRIGDVFAIPFPGGREGYGQIVLPGDALYVVVFEPLLASRPEIASIGRMPILLVGWTLDSLLHTNKWTVIGNTVPEIGRIPFPAYRVLVSGEQRVHSFDGSKWRRARPGEIDLLDEKTIRSPVRYQNALMAHHALAMDDEDYRKLERPYVAARVLDI